MVVAPPPFGLQLHSIISFFAPCLLQESLAKLNEPIRKPGKRKIRSEAKWLLFAT